MFMSISNIYAHTVFFSGVCQTNTDSSSPHNAGNAVNPLSYDGKVVMQSFTGGEYCHGHKYQRSTYLSFVCNSNRGLGRPVFLGETDDCTYYISWHTNLVCDNAVRSQKAMFCVYSPLIGL